jgi:hypothetical protein
MISVFRNDGRATKAIVDANGGRVNVARRQVPIVQCFSCYDTIDRIRSAQGHVDPSKLDVVVLERDAPGRCDSVFEAGTGVPAVMPTLIVPLTSGGRPEIDGRCFTCAPA